MTENDTCDPELTATESKLVARLTPEELSRIDSALLSQASNDWRKVARVVGMAMLAMTGRPNGVPDIFFAKRVALLVESGQLESQGDLRRMRFGEVRLRSA